MYTILLLLRSTLYILNNPLIRVNGFVLRYNLDFNKTLLPHKNKFQGENDVTAPELNVYTGLYWMYD